MAFAEEAGLKSIKEIESKALPQVAEIVNGAIQNASVLLTGAITALDGERLLAIGQVKTDLVDPLLIELKAWREQLAAGLDGEIGGMKFVIRGIKPTV